MFQVQRGLLPKVGELEGQSHRREVWKRAKNSKFIRPTILHGHLPNERKLTRTTIRRMVANTQGDEHNEAKSNEKHGDCEPVPIVGILRLEAEQLRKTRD